jgi:putative ABC transport system permease protein
VNPPPFWITFSLDYRVMLFVLGVIGLASVVAGTLPALHAARVTAGSALKDDSRGSTSVSLGKFSSGLVVAELGGLVRPAHRRRPHDQERHAAEEPADAVRDRAHPDGPCRSARRPATRIPRRASGSSSSCCRGCRRCRRRGGDPLRRLPAAGNGSIPVQIEGKSYPQASDYPLAREGIVTAGYFDTFQAKVLRGREFTPADTSASQPVAIVNESFARTHYPNLDPSATR